nr:tomoregulin-1 [Taeniopygia guttata]
MSPARPGTPHRSVRGRPRREGGRCRRRSPCPPSEEKPLTSPPVPGEGAAITCASSPISLSLSLSLPPPPPPPRRRRRQQQSLGSAPFVAGGAAALPGAAHKGARPGAAAALCGRARTERGPGGDSPARAPAAAAAAAAAGPCGRCGGDAEGALRSGGERRVPPGRRRGLRLMLRACRRHPAAAGATPRPPLAMLGESPAAARPLLRAGPPLALCYTSALLVLALSALPTGRASHPLPGSECQGGGKGKGINCSELNVRESDVRACDESSCKYGGVCKEEGDGLKCACQFQCHTNYIPVCGSNGDTYQNECFLRRAACKHQKEITMVSRGPCYSDNGSGSGEGEYEGSGTEVQRKHSKCGVCKYRAECDEDAENVGCVCNIDCSGYSFNPVCASDGSSYNNPCFVREASCLRQEQIDIRHLGHCSETDDTNAVGKKDDGMQYRPDVKDASDQREDIYIGNHIPCSESFNGYCIHGKCEFIYSTQKASCRCESGYTGQHCEKTDFSILYVVPSRQKLTHVLIAAIIGAVQIAIIVAIVMCITRKCPKNNRGRRQKQNLGHFTSDTSSRMV